jgi:hypothetical protein
MSGSAAASSAHKLATSPAVRALARSGFAASGLMHILIGLLAIGVAVGAGGGESDQSGALKQIAQTPGGVVLLWIMVAGLGVLGAWLIAGAFLISADDPKKKWSRRIAEIGKGVVYLALAGTAFTFARGGSSSSASSTRTLSATILSAPGGAILLTVIGLAVVGGGVYFVVIGARRRFEKDITMPSGTTGKVVARIGTAGYIAKGIVLAIVGILFVVAAFTSDARKASGVDGALKSLVSLPFGVVLLVLVGIGLIAYGLYCFARARYARL